MAMAIRAIPVLEGEADRRFIKEAKENEKKRGTDKFSDEDVAAYKGIIENARRLGTLPF